MKNHFNLCSEGNTAAQLAQARREALDAANRFGRVRFDGEASAVMGTGVVVSVHKVQGEYLTIELDSDTDAIAFVAEANGETVEDVVGSAKAHAEYLHNPRTGRKPRR